MKITEIVWAYGHKNVLSTHNTTLEVTKKETLTKRGDCIIAVRATKGALDIHQRFKETARRRNAQLIMIIETDGMKERVKAYGSSRLTFTNPTDIVIRKSNYVCGRTIAIGADKAAWELSRTLVEKLKDPYQVIKITLIAKSH